MPMWVKSVREKISHTGSQRRGFSGCSQLIQQGRGRSERGKGNRRLFVWGGVDPGYLRKIEKRRTLPEAYSFRRRLLGEPKGKLLNLGNRKTSP